MDGAEAGVLRPGSGRGTTRLFLAPLTLRLMRLRYLLLAMSGVVVASSACSTDATSPLPFAAPESAGFQKGGVKPPENDMDTTAEDDYTFRLRSPRP